MSTTNPFAKYTDPAASADQDNPFAKYVQPVAAPVQPKRSLWTAINDNVIEVANAAAGNASAVANFVRPGNAASQWIDKNFIEAGQNKQSDVVKAEKARYAQEMEQAQGFGDEVSSTLGYVARNPLLAAAQAAGSFAGPGLVAGGARAAAGALGMVGKAATRTGLAAGAGFGMASAGGDAAGTAYELSRQGGATDEQALAAARGASVIPGAIGAAGGLVGAERLVAGAKGFGGGLAARALKTGAVEGAQEALEEGVTQYEGQRAAVPFNPELDPTKGVAGAATMGAVLGGMTGGGASLLTGQNQPARKPSEDLGLNPDSGPISKVAAAAVDEGRAAVPMQPEQAAQSEDGLSLAPEEQAQPQGPTMEERLAALPEQARAQADQLLREIADERVPAGVKRFRANELQQLLDAYPVPESTDTFNPEERAAMGPIVRGYDPATGEAPGRPLELEGERYQDGIDFATDEQPSQNAYQDEINRIALESYQTPGQPLAMEQAGRLRDAAREQGIPATIVPHPSGRGFDVQATAVLPEAARQQVAQDPVAAALPYDNSPTGRMVADAQGNVRPELRPEAVGREVGWNQELAQMEADVRQSEALGMSNLRKRIEVFRQKQAEVVSMARQANPPAQAGAASVANTAMQPKEGQILQNRDRSTPGSIEQMQRIAAAPDYGRLGFSRDFANGAPVVTDANIDSSQLGRTDIAVASDGRRIPVQYAVVEADTVLPSNRVDGSPNAEYATAADRMRAIAGNGRIAGLQAAAQRGTNGQYVQELTNDTMHGINPQVIAAMRAPVLVRIMPQEQVTDDIGDVSNTTGNLQLSAVEQSRNDAQRVDLSVLEFAEDGGVTAKAVRQFVQAMPQAERGALLDVNGQPTKQAVDRLHAAVFSSAYGNDQLVRLYAQAQDPEARLILSALAKLAPKFARLEGAGALDIRPIVTQAAEIAVNARRNGTPLAQAAQQLDIAADPLVGVVLKLFAQNPRSNKLVIERLGNAADMAYAEAFKPDADMFGPVPRATREQVVNQLEPQNEPTSTQNLEQPAGREPVPADVIEQATAGAAQPSGAATEAGTAAAAGQQQDAETVASTARQQTNSQQNESENAVDQAQAATNQSPANLQEGNDAAQGQPPASTKPESEIKKGDARALFSGKAMDRTRKAVPADARAMEQFIADGKEAEFQRLLSIRQTGRDNLTDEEASQFYDLRTERNQAKAAVENAGYDRVKPSPHPAQSQQAQEGDAVAQRFEIGNSLTKEQRKQVLESLVDVYKSKGAEREFKGQDANGNDRYGYAHSPELFEKSDITGTMVRYYVTLPDGRIAHPTELFPDYSQSDIEAELSRQQAEEQRISDSVSRQTAPSVQFDNRSDANKHWNLKSLESMKQYGSRTVLPATERTALSNGKKIVLVPNDSYAENANAYEAAGWRKEGEAAHDNVQQDEDVRPEARKIENKEAAARKAKPLTQAQQDYESRKGMKETAADKPADEGASSSAADLHIKAQSLRDQAMRLPEGGQREAAMQKARAVLQEANAAQAREKKQARDAKRTISGEFHPPSSVPPVPGVYQLRDNTFARFDHGLWWRAMLTPNEVLKTEFSAVGAMTPEQRTSPAYAWRLHAEIGKRDAFGTPLTMKASKKYRDTSQGEDGKVALFSRSDAKPLTQAQQAQDGNGAMFSRSDAKPVTNPTAVKMRRAMVQRTVDALAKGWAKAPNVTVVDSMQDERVPEAVRKADAAQRSQGAMGEPEGFWYRGQVYLVASALPTSADAARVLYHEVLGHHGLRGHFGKDLDRVLDQVIKLRRKDVQAKAQEYGLDMGDPKHAGYAAEEVLAELAQSRPDLGFVQRAIAAIRNFLRTHVPGFKVLELTDADIVQGYLLPARGWVERGGVRGAVNGDTRFSFAGERANTADTMALATAQQRLDAGENAEIVRQETGWHKGVDGKWRFEINDADAKYIGKEAMEQAAENDPYKMAEMRLEEVLDHPALFAAYPGLRDVSVAYEASSAADGDLYYGASYNAQDNVITIGNGLDEGAQLSALLHEIQHGIQNVEGFATGGGLETAKADVLEGLRTQLYFWANVYSLRREMDAKGITAQEAAAAEAEFTGEEPNADAVQIASDPGLQTAVAEQNMQRLEQEIARIRKKGARGVYEAMAGEVEARNTQARQGMTDAQRRATPPSQTADVADSDVIVTFNGKQAASAPAPANTGVRFSRSGSTYTADQTQTEAFKRWFGDSKAVDAEGKPLVVYHGTLADFSEFDGKGLYFVTPSAEFSEKFTKSEDGGFAEGAKVMPVYVKASNPFDYENKKHVDIVSRRAYLQPHAVKEVRQGKWQRIEDRTIIAAIKKSGFDGIYVNEEGVKNLAVFDPSQIKSATGNNGQFDPTNPDIRFSRSAAPSLSEVAETGRDTAWTGPAASKWDDFIYKMQDKHIDTKRALEAVRETGKAVSDELDVYLQEELYHGRAAKRTEDFVKQELEPLLQYLSSAGLKMADVEEYLHARHAKEANAVIAQRNPSLPDGGSGMTNAEADAVLGAYAPMRLKLLEKAAAQVDAIIAGTRNTFVEYGLESQDVVDGWAQSFAHYVPLMREQEGDGMAGLGTGQGFSIKGKEVKGRTGSTKKVVDILANIAMQRERAIVRGEKNRVAAALVGLAKAHPSDFWKVDVVPTRQVLGKDGMVKSEHDPLYKQRDNVVVAKIPELDAKTGKVLVKEHAVLFNENDARALRMAQALKNLDAAQLEGMLGATAKVTRYLAAINTQYNPIFGITNLARDLQGAVINLQSTALAGRLGEVLTQALPALRGIYAEMRSQRKGSTTGTQWSKLWEEFQEVGGQTGYRDQFRTSADRGQAIERALDPSSWAETNWGRFFTAGGRLKVPLEMVRKGMAPVLNWLDDYNTAMENGVRLAAYKAGLDAGLSKERAASIAKNLTTNFNRKGQVAQQVGALYAFFNASMQGTARIGEALFTMESGHPKTLRLSALGRKVVSGGVLLGAGQALMLAAAGFGDDEPPEHVRERNLVIPLGDKRYATIPLPLGLHVLPNLGRIPTEFALGGFKNPAEQVLKVAGLFADAFNPVGNSGLSMQTLVPTVLDPLAALAENQDFAGRAIAKESFNPITPGHALARDTATAHAKLIAEAVNFLSGGTAHVRGALSPTPDQIDYLIGQFTGGVGRELSKLQQSVVGAAQGDDVPAHKVPVLGRFYGDANSPSAKQAAFYNHLDSIARHAEQVKGLRLEGEAQAANTYLQEHPEARLALAAKATSRAIQKMREQRRELEQKGAAREQVRQIEEQMTARMEQFNAQVERAMQ